MRIESPYDTEARYATKRSLSWSGYKVHVTETCDPEGPHLITHVEMTQAHIQAAEMAASIQAALAQKALLPKEHLLDAGYAVLGGSRAAMLNLAPWRIASATQRAAPEGAFQGQPRVSTLANRHIENGWEPCTTVDNGVGRV